MKNEKWEKNFLEIIIKKSVNKYDVLKKLNLKPFTGNYDTLNKYIKLYDIDCSHFKRGVYKKNNIPYNKVSLSEILVSNSAFSRSHLKKRLYHEGLKPHMCELCGQDENWHGKKMSLILDHINGINNDNRIENLRIVCPNCNATFSTHCGKNVGDYKIKNIIQKIKVNKIKYCSCGIKIRQNSKQCIDCHNLNNRKTIRPSYQQLINEIEMFGYSATGRKYEVSDNTIRKWKKTYEKNN